MRRRTLALWLGCVALLATAGARAQQRDLSGLFPDAGASEVVDAGELEHDASPGQGPGTSDEPPPDLGEPPLDPDEPSIPEDAIPTLPEGHEPTLTVRLTPTDGLVTGDVVHYELTVEVPEGDDVNLPRQTYAPLELIGQDHEESVANGRRRFVYTLDLLALSPGEVTIPGLVVRVITDDGIVGAARTEPQTITIGSLVANEPDAQPRPPTEPVVVMQDDYTLAYVAGGLGLVLLGALLAWLFLRWWRARPKELPPPPPPRPAHEVALEKLRSLRRDLTGAIAEGSQARVVDGASDALREYLGHRFGFNGLESTTDEVVARMRRERLAGPTLTELVVLLGECDLVKFAKAVPDQADCERVITEAERLVQRTMHANVVSITPPAAAPLPPTTKEPKLVDPQTQPRPEKLSAPEPRRIPLTNPPPRGPDGGEPEADVAASPAPPTTPSFAIPRTPVPPPAPRDSEPDLAPPPPSEIAAKAKEALAKASEAAAKASGGSDSASGGGERASGGGENASAAPMVTAILGGAGAEASSDESVWDALEDAVASDRLVVGEVIARREEGFLIGLGAGVHGVLPEAQLGSLDADALVGERRAFRVVSLNAGKKRIVLTHRDVEPAAERALVGRATPIGFSDPSGEAP